MLIFPEKMHPITEQLLFYSSIQLILVHAYLKLDLQILITNKIQDHKIC